MAFENFIPTVWNEGITRDLERLCVFAEDCNQNFTGKVKRQGDQVRILGVGKVTIKSLTRTSRSSTIDIPEDIEDTSVTMIIDQIKYYNFQVNDFDEAQAVDGLMDILRAEAAEGLANAADAYIASMVADSNVKKVYSADKKIVTGTAGENEKNVLDALDDADLKLSENDVPANTKVVVTASPRFIKLFNKEYISRDTNNSEKLANGQIAKYGRMIIKQSNNVYTTTSGAVDNIMVRTQRAVAYACPLKSATPFKPEGTFSDAIKGYILFGAKVVRPKEIMNLNVKYA